MASCEYYILQPEHEKMLARAREDKPLLDRIFQSNALLAAALVLFSLWPAAAQQQQACMMSYYRNKSPACVDEVIRQIGELPPNSKSDPFVGFLAQVFRDSPQERERILKGEMSGVVKVVALKSLYRAGLNEEAKKFAAALDLLATMEKLGFRPDPTLDDIKPSSLPGDNDLLIGAYSASGKAAFIHQILSNYSSADDAMASAGLRIGFMNGKFGPTLAPKGREPAIMQAACAKYQCKTDSTRMLRVMTLSSAIWALQSLAANDDNIKKALADFFGNDTRLKNMYAAEQTAFGNYLTAVVTVTALKDVQRTAEQDRAFAAMGKAASIYENLGSIEEASAPMAPYRKK